jgi:ferredoxin, 2Fe-2S
VAVVIHATDREGVEHAIDALPGRSLMVNLKYQGNLDVAADCGGNAFCGTCHIYVQENWRRRLPEQTEEELDLLADLVHSGADSRLACQIRVDEGVDGLRLLLAPKE